MNTLKSIFNSSAPAAVCATGWFTAMTLYSNARHDTFFRFEEATRDAIAGNFGYAALAITGASILAARAWYKAREEKAPAGP